MKHDNLSMESLLSQIENNEISNNKNLESLFKELDSNLKKLGCSDSSVEFAPHINKHFEKSIESLNLIKKELNIKTKDCIDYYI